MNLKKISKILTFTLFFSTITPLQASAFQPASHCLLIEQVKDGLPQDSVIKKSIETYPGIADWGANAPDLGYLQPGQVLERAPWADRYHYYKVGTFASEQLKTALASKDMKKIAFASGWVSHVTGDLACHGIFVNPECGVYLDNEGTRPQHRKLESNAEAVVWSDICKKPIENYNKGIYSMFSNINDIPFDMINSVSQRIYNEQQNTTEQKLQCTTLLTGLKTGIGYTYGNLSDSQNFLAENGRVERLHNAFTEGKTMCTSLLTQAEKGDFSKFSDRWNLDVGKSNSPISSLTAIVKTGNKFGAGTNDDIFLNIKLKNGESKEWKLDKKNYNDFEQGNLDEYYLYINDINFMPSDVSTVSVKKKKASTSLCADWYLKSINVNVNGIDALSENVDNWIQGDDAVKDFKVDWSYITNLSDF